MGERRRWRGDGNKREMLNNARNIMRNHGFKGINFNKIKQFLVKPPWHEV